MSQYVCAFRGRRDNYQVPLALAEAGLLDRFITDFYTLSTLRRLAHYLPEAWQEKLVFRYHSDLPDEKVSCLWLASFQEHARLLLKRSAAATYAAIDPIFSLSAAQQAKKTLSNLLLYSPYAWEAFRSSYNHDPLKVLFQFHPHSSFEDTLLEQDYRLYPQIEYSYHEEVGKKISPEAKKRERDSWQYADLIICTSSFTRHTLIHAGASPECIYVIPYGVDLPIIEKQTPPDKFQVLFVGSGIQRKGLHHLLSAWQQAKLPKESQLILVCRTLDPGLRSMVENTPRVKLLRGVNFQSLAKFYQTSSLFVMPSLVEGFGQVFLEALSYGCPVLGTTHTCLPDLGQESDAIFLANVSDSEHLRFKLEHLADLLTNNTTIRDQARACASRFSWKQFRVSLCSLLKSF